MNNETPRPYYACPIEEQDTRVCLINEPIAPDNIAVLVPRSERSIHALLVENLNSVQALIARLERGVTVPVRGHETTRDLYVSARSLRDVLVAAPEIDGLE